MAVLVCTAENLRDGLFSPSVTVLDCRSLADFEYCHIKGALHILIPPLLERRMAKGLLTATAAIQGLPGPKNNKCLVECKQKDFILYDEFCEGNTINGAASKLSLLSEKLASEGYKIKILKGGFRQFSQSFPELVSTSSKQAESISTELVEQSGNGHLRTKIDSCISLSLFGCAEKQTPCAVEIIPNLYLGNMDCAKDKELLLRLNIKYIVNVTPDVGHYKDTGRDVKYMQIPVQDHPSQSLSVFFRPAINFIDEGRQKGHAVLVHCLAGISRSVAITLAYIMHHMNLRLNQAYSLVKSAKHDISPNLSFMGQLFQFEQTLNIGKLEQHSQVPSLSERKCCERSKELDGISCSIQHVAL